MKADSRPLAIFAAAVGADLPRGRCVALLYLAEEIIDGVIRSRDVRCRRAALHGSSRSVVCPAVSTDRQA